MDRKRVLELEILPGDVYYSEDPRGPLIISPDVGNTKLARHAVALCHSGAFYTLGCFALCAP